MGLHLGRGGRRVGSVRQNQFPSHGLLPVRGHRACWAGLSLLGTEGILDLHPAPRQSPMSWGHTTWCLHSSGDPHFIGNAHHRIRLRSGGGHCARLAMQGNLGMQPAVVWRMWPLSLSFPEHTALNTPCTCSGALVALAHDQSSVPLPNITEAHLSCPAASAIRNVTPLLCRQVGRSGSGL